MATTSHPASRSAAISGGERDESLLSILVIDKFEQSGLDGLKALGATVINKPDAIGEAMLPAVLEHDPDVLIVRGSKVPGAVFEKAGKLSLVVRAGAGYDTIDVSAASSRGVYVANCPGKNAIAVAELVWALILASDRRVPDQVADLRAGTWNKKEYSKAQGLYGRTLGVIGMGEIGQEVASRGKAFGMNVVAWSRSLTQEKADALDLGFCNSIVNLAKMSDVVSVNVAAVDETKHLINEQFLAAMKPGALIINSSRGSVLDEAALAKAIQTKGLRAGLDVFADEPAGGTGTFSPAIVKQPGVYGTHHVGASTDQAQQAIAREVVRIVRCYMQKGEVPNCVNQAASTPATTLLTVRHLNRPGVLAHVFYTLGQAGINVEDMQNIIYAGAKAACARIALDDCPSPDHLTAIRTNENVLSVTMSRIMRPVK